MGIFDGINRLLGSQPQGDDAHLAKLQAFVEKLSTASDREGVLTLLYEELETSLNAKRMAFFMNAPADAPDAVKLKLHPKREGEFKRNEFVLWHASPIYSRLFVQNDPLLLSELDNVAVFKTVVDDEKAFFKELDCTAVVPTTGLGNINGFLVMKTSRPTLSVSDLRWLAILGKQAGMMLQSCLLTEMLKRQEREARETQKALQLAKDQIEQLDDVKTDFITIASHELRTPLAQVRGYSDIITALNSQGILDPEQLTSMTGNLRKATDRMEDLIRNMLDVSQLDVNAMDLNFATVTVENVVRLAIEPITEAMRDRKQSLGARGLKGLPAIQADMKRLVQAFHNVIVNAVKFTPDGGAIDIYGMLNQNPETGEEEIMISVADTGIGIDPKNREMIFEKFVRTQDPSLHSTGKTKFMGAGPGLGLTIAQGVIKGHGGRIWVESAGYDEQSLPGSTFYIVLPTKPPEDASRVLHFERTEDERNARERMSEKIEQDTKRATGEHEAVQTSNMRRPSQ